MPTDDDAVEVCSDGLTRRHLVQSLLAMLGGAALPTRVVWNAGLQLVVPLEKAQEWRYGQTVLPTGIRSRLIGNVNGITMQVLEAGFEEKNRPAVVLLHGFPELAYSWRKVMLPLAAAGYYVVAPYRRGYGRTSGSDVRYDDDLDPFATLNQVRDVVALVSVLGYRSVAAVIGHDQGSPIAAWCSLIRPDVFRSVVMMSAPFGGPPALPFNVPDTTRASKASVVDPIYEELAALHPPRKYYQRYFATREANDNMWHAPQGIHAFLRAYYHMKSADWKQNAPFPLAARTANEWAKLPRYYVMDLDKGMAETVAAEMPSAAAIAACKWLPDDELQVYSGEYDRTSFQGGLQGYRLRWIAKYTAELQMFSGRTIDVPSLFIGGKSDWGVYQTPGEVERMQSSACTRMLAVHLVDGAGHWVQQEQPEAVCDLFLRFLHDQTG
jgi:pimeloyl-ACP methyl ester carboxylesterase